MNISEREKHIDFIASMAIGLRAGLGDPEIILADVRRALSDLERYTSSLKDEAYVVRAQAMIEKLRSKLPEVQEMAQWQAARRSHRVDLRHSQQAKLPLPQSTPPSWPAPESRHPLATSLFSLVSTIIRDSAKLLRLPADSLN